MTSSDVVRPNAFSAGDDPMRQHGGMTTPERHLTIDVEGTSVSGVFARPADSAATIVVAHGAGAGMEHPFMSGFTRAMNDLGFATLRFNFPYREAGRRFPDRPPVALATWRAALDAAESRAGAGEPIWASGKSFGGRMASMALADGMPAVGLVYLGYPLHPPGSPEKARDEHLPGITVPMLFLQGRNDPFATPNEQLDEVVARIGPTATLQWIENANHSFEVKGAKRPAAEIGAGLAPRVAEFIRAVG
jgi:predicted alpha/beta-hydrolase family hydrolase